MIDQTTPHHEYLPVQSRPKLIAINQNRLNTIVSAAIMVGLIFVDIIFLSIGMIFIQESINNQILLEEEGVTSIGKITQLFSEEDNEGDLDYFVIYTYAARDKKQTYQSTADVNQNEYSALHVGEYIPILYVSSQPSISKMELEYKKQLGTKKYLLPVLFFSGSLLFGLVPVFILGSAIRTAINLSKLNQEGSTTSARIIGHWIETDSEGGETYFLGFEYLPLNPNSIEMLRLKQIVSHTDYFFIEDNSVQTVRYLPIRPQIARLELKYP